MGTKNQYKPQSVPHPGKTLEEKLEEMGMGPKEFALRTGKPEKTISAILKGDSSLTPDMAVQFENVTKVPAHFWLNLQRDYDEYIAREKRQAVIEESIDWIKQFPIKEMVAKKWLPPVKTAHEQAIAMLTFFGFSSHTAWEDYYLKQQLKVAFRISLANTNEPYAISAWLRMGELQAAELHAEIYSEKKFKEALAELKKVIAEHPSNFFRLLQGVCLSAGVKVVHTPTLPKAPICGCTRWINDTPLIQLTGRYNRNDSFWFTFFHEAGHIVLHGKKDIFLEKVEYSDKDKQKETEADEFAIKCTLSKEEEATILKALPLDEQKIKQLSSQFNTHPAIIIGRLQHKKLIPYSWGNEYLEPVIFE
jgi:HTH-type transcriptional regulator / antitoxin HigA